MKEYSSRLLERYEKEGVLSIVAGELIEPRRKQDLHDTLKSLYEIQPKLFSNLSNDQKKTIVALLDGLLVSDQRSQIVNLLAGIVDMEPEEHAELEQMLM